MVQSLVARVKSLYVIQTLGIGKGNQELKYGGLSAVKPCERCHHLRCIKLIDDF